MPIKYNADGLLDSYLQAKSPGSDKESNWLQTPPTGAFNRTARVYQPTKEVLDGAWKLPTITKVK